jgi:hypothetical protein
MKSILLMAVASAISVSSLALAPGANAQSSSSLSDAPGFDPSIPPVIVNPPVVPEAPTTIFDAGAPNLDDGKEMTFWVQADDFILGSDATLTGVNFWTIESGTTWDGTLDYYIFSDNNGQPASSPLFSGSGTNITRTATGNSAYGYLEYAYGFDLATPQALTGGTRYWLGLHLAADFNNQDYIYWVTTGGNFGLTSQASQEGTFDNWADRRYSGIIFYYLLIRCRTPCITHLTSSTSTIVVT